MMISFRYLPHSVHSLHDLTMCLIFFHMAETAIQTPEIERPLASKQQAVVYALASQEVQ